jgi:hypothetical protein
MSQKTETDLRDLKDLIKAMDNKMDLGFNTIEGKIDKLDTRMTLVESAITKLDNRLWTFGGIALSVTLGLLLTVFIRYMFSELTIN